MSSPNALDLAIATIIAELDRGTAPWRKPWTSTCAGLPKRSTGEAFSGMNAVLLSTIGLARGFASPYWLTFNQALDLGAAVRKGEKGSPAILYKTKVVDGDSEKGEDDKVLRFLRSYTVFNAGQIDGLPERFHPPAPVASGSVALQDNVLAIMRTFPVPVVHGGQVACYMPGFDRIHMPARSDFDSDEDYVATLFHEYAHATGHSSRLDRFAGDQDKDEYAREELVAELASHLLSLHLGIPPSQALFANHLSYLGSWAARLKDRPAELLKAASKAQAACDLILVYRDAAADAIAA
jgi:antirestriction protein ArdC